MAAAPTFLLTTAPPTGWQLIAQWLPPVAAFLTLLVAIWAIAIAKRQIKASQESAVSTLFVDHLKLCLEYPKLAQPDRPYNEDITFENFMAITLLTYEEVLRIFPDDERWNDDIKYNLKEDRQYMIGLEAKKPHYFKEGWSEALIKIIREVIDHPEQDAAGHQEAKHA